MKTTIETQEHAGPDKLLHLTIPVEEANRRYRVTILLEPETGPQPPVRTWPPGFFENTAGAWVGDLERPPQGEFEKREEL